MKYRRGDVYLAKLNPAKGSEPGKERPVIILQSNSLNELAYPTCIVIPCSSKEMPVNSIRPLLYGKFFDRPTYALLDQVRSVDVNKRLTRKIGIIEEQQLEAIVKKLCLLVSQLLQLVS